jgi:hypothetical protein
MMMLKNFFILSTLITVGSNAYADGNQSTDSDAGAVHAKDDWSSSPNFGTFSTSLPFGWLDNVFSGYTFLGFGYSRLLMLGNSNIGMIAGADYALFEFSSYKQRVGQGGEDGTYTIIPARLNVSIASGYHRFYGYAGVSLCVPVYSFEPLSNTTSPTGIDGIYWQSHYGVGYHLMRHFDIGLRTAIALTKFNAGDGRGYDNNITLVGAARF